VRPAGVARPKSRGRRARPRRFAARCRDVALGAASNKPDALELAKAHREIKALRAKLARAEAAQGSPSKAR
jgi:hypothetical protein